jgi:peptide deformylase
MALREIVKIPEPVLRRKAHKITDFGPDLQTLINDMIETMREAPGVGLAAPQINVSLRLIVVEYAESDDEQEEDPKPRLYIVVNPEIIKASPETELGTEACLSIPGFSGDVNRATTIVVKGLNRRGQPLRIKAEGWLARIFQHEIDHLDGVLFTDRAEHVWKVEGDPAQVAPVD